MIKRYITLITVAVTAFVIFISFSINTSIQNKARLSKIKSIYFPVLEKLDTTIVRIDNIENLLVQFVTTGDESLLNEVRLLKKESSLTLLDIQLIYSPYRAPITDIANDLEKYFEYGIKASSLFQAQQLDSKIPVNINMLEESINLMNQKRDSLRTKIKSFRQNIHNNFNETLFASNKDADNSLYIGIVLACFNLAIIIILVHFVKQYLSLLGIIKEHNKNLEILVDERTQEIRDMQEELVESKKMASLAGLVNGVAHEINTPLGACITAASHLESQIYNTPAPGIQSPDNNPESNRDSKLKPIINLITSNLENIAALVDTFKLTATHQGKEEEKTINLNEFLNHCLMQEKIRATNNSISLMFEIDDGIQITTYPQILSHIIISVIDNSFTHAFEDITNEKIITISAEYVSDNVEISISDNGTGMEDINVKEIFDPFYTTKRGQGHHGLGLHITYNIIKHKLLGKINCTSEINKGTKTIISLPVDITNKS